MQRQSSVEEANGIRIHGAHVLMDIVAMRGSRGRFLRGVSSITTILLRFLRSKVKAKKAGSNEILVNVFQALGTLGALVRNCFNGQVFAASLLQHNLFVLNSSGCLAVMIVFSHLQKGSNGLGGSLEFIDDTAILLLAIVVLLLLSTVRVESRAAAVGVRQKRNGLVVYLLCKVHNVLPFALSCCSFFVLAQEAWCFVLFM
mmetsp:Transcript_14891/g.32464  ORF Transcript_14891/g.32464 Transcript_14891/m.32464 type:complete len:201 (-) Transcript_14891:120-722(-)